MKGGIQGLKVSQVSLILIGFVCVTVLAFTWRKTMLLTTFIPDQSRVLQLDLDIPASVVERTDSEEGFQRKNKSKEADTSYVEIDQTGNISTTTENKEISASVIERKGLGEHSDRKNKPQEAYVMPESVESDSAGNLTATTGREDFPPSVVESPASIKHPRGNDKPEQDEIVPGYSLKNESSAKTEQIKPSSNITRTKDCNYAKGEWVFDDSRPLYSGFGCKQWLSSMWACRLTQRTDFEFEKFRWQPKGCQMEVFTGPKFLQRMQDKTLAFIGDSLGRQQFQSMMCMATGGEEMTDVIDVGPEYGLAKASTNVRPDGWAFRFPRTNTTILYYWSASLCDLVPIDPSNPSTSIAMHLDRPPAFLRLYIHKLHVIVLNTGHHWNRGKLNANRWVMHVGGKPNTNKKIAPIGGAKNFTIHSIVKWVDSQLPLYPGLKVFFRTISPRHFFNGEWNTGGTCDNTTPHAKEVVQDESSDPVIAGAVRGTDVRLLDITGLSEVRDEGHISRYSIRATPGVQDCLHWCLPGIPDAWNEVLFTQI